MWQFLLIPFLTLPTACNAELGSEVLHQYVSASFLNNHNRIRERSERNLLEWSDILASKAKTIALGLARACWTNSLGNGLNLNILQIWGSQSYTPKSVVDRWAKLPKTRKVILGQSSFIGCAYAHCVDAESLARSVIFVCKFGGTK